MFKMLRIFFTLSCLLGKCHKLDALNQNAVNKNSINTRWIVNRVNQFLNTLEPKTIGLEMFIAILDKGDPYSK